jgi:hypothetical protein
MAMIARRSNFEMRVSDGFVKRGDDGKIIAHVEFAGVTTHNSAAMAIMGIDKATFATADQLISTQSNSPSIFESTTDFTVSRGTLLPHLFGAGTELEGDIIGRMYIRAAMYYCAGVVSGEYIAFSDQDIIVPGQKKFRLEMDYAGNFELKVDA